MDSFRSWKTHHKKDIRYKSVWSFFDHFVKFLSHKKKSLFVFTCVGACTRFLVGQKIHFSKFLFWIAFTKVLSAYKNLFYYFIISIACTHVLIAHLCLFLFLFMINCLLNFVKFSSKEKIVLIYNFGHLYPIFNARKIHFDLFLASFIFTNIFLSHIEFHFIFI